MKTYPYDPRGINPECHFTEERIIDSDDPKDRVVMLDHRPFFEGLVVALAGSSIPLTRGTDYELEYALTPLDDSVTTPVFCGVHLINPNLRGALVFEGQMLGGTFYSGLTEMLDELIKALNNPTSADWLLLDHRPALFPATPAATSWADLLNKKYIASAVRDVELDAGAANDRIRERLEELKDEALGLAGGIERFAYPTSHIAATNPHQTTTAQINAHPVDLKTPDTFLAYGKKLRQLTAEIRALGLRQSDIDKYISKWVSADSKGTFTATMSGNRALFRSPAGESEIVFSDNAFTLKSNGSVILACGYDGETTTRFMEWRAGINTLRIESTGSELGMDRLTLNGTMLLTTTALMGYQQDSNSGTNTDPDDNKLYIEGRGGITFTGKGSKADPVTGTVTGTKATTTLDGVVKLKSGPGPETVGVASTPDSLTRYEGDLSSYVLKDTLLNNKPMNDGARVITKADLGLGLADNTADVDKPISDDQAEALANLSEKNHHHSWASLQIPPASQTVQGIGRFSNNQAGLAATRGVTPNVLMELSNRLDVVAGLLANAKEDSVTDFAAVRSSTWTVSSSYSSLNVTDLNYFYLSNGVRKEGTVSGSVDLQTTPMFLWHSPDNLMENTWQNAVINTAPGIVFDGFEIALPFPLSQFGSQIGLTTTGVGDISMVTLLAKTRVRCDTGKLRIWVSGGGPVTVYLNGENIGAGITGPGYLEATVTAGDHEHCLAFKAECNDSSKAAAIRFAVFDGSYPVGASGTTTKVARLQEFVTTMNGLRHYLYVNMNTDALYSRAEPITSSSDAVSVERGFIGYIDVPESGLVAGNHYSFQTTFDYGMASEISKHIAVPNAHGVAKSDWSLVDNQKMLPLNRLELAPEQWVFAKPRSAVTGTHQARLDKGMFDYSYDSASATDVYFQAVVRTDAPTPYSWLTPYNPKEGGKTTVEGSVVIDCDHPAAPVETNRTIGLTFMAKPDSVQDEQRMVVWRESDLKIGFGFIDSVYSITPGHSETMLGSGTTFIGGPARTIVDTTISDSLALDYVVEYPGQWTKAGTRWLLRYRYIVESRILRISLLSKKPSETTIRVRELEYDLPFDALDYFNGYSLGINVSDIVVGEHITINHGLLQPNTTAVNIDRFHYLRSLLETYVTRVIADPSAGIDDYTMRRLSATTHCDNVTSLITESIIVSACGEGCPDLAHEGQLALPFHRRQLKRGSLLAKRMKLPNDYGWRGAVWRNGIIRAHRLTNGELIRSLYGTIRSNYPGYIIVGTENDPANVYAFPAATGPLDEHRVSMTLKYTKPGQRIFVVFNPPAGVVPPADVSYEIDVNGSDGTAMYIIDASGYTDLRTGGDVLVIEKRNPFHITSKVWDWLLTVLATERQSDGNAAGEWAS